MKIAIFVHCFFPDHFYGTETYTLHVAKHLLEMGHEAIVVSAIYQGEPKADAIVTRYTYEGVPVICIDKNFMPHSSVRETYYQEDMQEVLRDVLLEINPDIVHVTHIINHTAAVRRRARCATTACTATRNPKTQTDRAIQKPISTFASVITHLVESVAEGSECTARPQQPRN